MLATLKNICTLFHNGERYFPEGGRKHCGSVSPQGTHCGSDKTETSEKYYEKCGGVEAAKEL